MKPTIKDVAKVAGVSVATVSRVMNKKGYLSEEIIAKVNNAIEEIGYIPNQVAKSFFTKKSNLIGVIVPTILNPYFSELVYHIEKYAAKQGLKILLCNSLNDPEIERKYVQMLLENQVDGIIVGTHNEELKEYATPNVPIIAIERFLDNKRVPTVCCDNADGARVAMEYLVSKGCKNVLCFSGESKENYPANDRRKVFSEFSKNKNLNANVIEVNSFDSENIHNEISIAIEKYKDFDGIFATDDIIALNTIEVLDKIEKKINIDYHIVGFDGTELIRSLYPKLTTVKQPIFELAKFSINHLLSLIEGEKVPRITILPIELIENV